MAKPLRWKQWNNDDALHEAIPCPLFKYGVSHTAWFMEVQMTDWAYNTTMVTHSHGQVRTMSAAKKKCQQHWDKHVAYIMRTQKEK